MQQCIIYFPWSGPNELNYRSESTNNVLLWIFWLISLNIEQYWKHPSKRLARCNVVFVQFKNTSGAWLKIILLLLFTVIYAHTPHEDLFKCVPKFWGTELLTMHFLHRICKQSSREAWNPPFKLKLHVVVGKAQCMLIKPSSFEEHPDSCKALIHDGLFWTLSNNWPIPLVRMGLQSLSAPWQCNGLLCTFHVALNLSSFPPQLNF